MNIRTTVLTALFAALISVGAYLAIPIGSVPITLQNLFILTAGFLGGRRIGFSAVFLYLLAGAVGLPVFSNGTGSLAHFFGPTGGYLLSYLPAVYISGLSTDLGVTLSRKGTDSYKPFIYVSLLCMGGLLATVIVYAIGVPWLKVVLGMDWGKAIAIGVTPFILGDLLKAIAAIALTTIFKSRIDQLLLGGNTHEST